MDLKQMMAYHCWAWEQLFSVLTELTEEQYTRPVTSSFPTIRDTGLPRRSFS